MRGRDCSGRWYPRPDRISIFVNKIAEHIDVDTPLFEAAIGACPLHITIRQEAIAAGTVKQVHSVPIDVALFPQ